MSELTHEDVQRILAIIDSIGDRTVSLEYGDIKLHMTRSGDTSHPPPSIARTLDVPNAADASASSGGVTVAAGASTGTTSPVPQRVPLAGARTVAVASGSAAPPAAPQTKQAPVQPAPKPDVPEGMVAVTAPTSGTFYRAGSPTAKPFVEVGDHVEANDTVAVFDVMKLFMSLRAGVRGTVTAILLDNQAVAEQGQPLVLIKPD